MTTLTQKIILGICLLFSAMLCQSQNAVLSDATYIYHQGRDTIRFGLNRLLYQGWNESASIVDSIQIDGLGAKELIILSQGKKEIHNFYGDADNQGKAHFSKYEIWNLDTKRLILAVVTDYHEDAYEPDVRSMPPAIVGSYGSHCEFSIDSLGLVTISGSNDNSGNEKAALHSQNATPAILPYPAGMQMPTLRFQPLANGTYRFVDGKYKLQ